MSFKPRGSKPQEIFVLDDVEVIAESDKALLVKTSEFDEEWVPKSQIDGDQTTVHERGDIGRLAVFLWLAEKKGWTP